MENLGHDLFWLAIVVLSVACTWMWIRHKQSRSITQNNEMPAKVVPYVSMAPSINQSDGEDEISWDDFQITPITEHDLGPLLPTGEEARQHLQLFLQQAPLAARFANEAKDKTMRVFFSPKTMRKWARGEVKIVTSKGAPLAQVRDASNGRFVETGKLAKSGGIKAVHVAAMAWQIASVATAQHYLGEINEKLQSIENQLSDVLFLLSEANTSKIKANLRLLRQYHTALQQGCASEEDLPDIRQTIENIERECLTFSEIAIKLLKRKSDDLSNVRIKSWFGRSGSSKRTNQLLNEYSEAARLLQLVQACRLYACQVRVCLPASQGFIKERLEDASRNAKIATQSIGELRARLFTRLGKLRKRKKALPALCGLFDKDYYVGIEERCQQIESDLQSMVENLSRQTDFALGFSNVIDDYSNCGLSFVVRQDVDGSINVLGLEASKGAVQATQDQAVASTL